MGDCSDFDLLPVSNYDEIDPVLWAYWTSTGKLFKYKKKQEQVFPFFESVRDQVATEKMRDLI